MSAKKGMSPKAILGMGLVLAFSGTGLALAQGDTEQSFGVFHARCETDQMSDVRSCNVSVNPGVLFFAKNHVSVFIAFLVPKTSDITTVGYIRRLRVDKNPPLVGDCIASTSGLCLFNNKKENARFLKELEKGTTLRLEVGDTIFDFDLEDYRKALAAYKDMEKTPTPPTPQGSGVPPTTF
jgi:hypothetical protein